MLRKVTSTSWDRKEQYVVKSVIVADTVQKAYGKYGHNRGGQDRVRVEYAMR
jgi:hypothetical protein